VNRNLGLFDVTGRVSASAGDSLLLFHPAGWLVRAVEEINPSSAASLACPYSAGPAIQMSVRVHASVAGVPVGAPIRAFHTYTYRLEQEGDSWWLARLDGVGSELLAGPFSAGTSGLQFAYVDSAGQTTTDPARVARVDFALVAENGSISTRRDTLTLSVRPRNQ
jgi:hypothetical protein